ncbi:unnamed protein product [Protopolystoma xenopodis]|uniref:Uncharacterized protein n=1 Tax=Protopolystoma xenopodis TaxID=117903 RepID=A0A448WDW5_9PLAT|nr:unnamed protein product [Protopolystoma xenopodis]
MDMLISNRQLKEIEKEVDEPNRRCNLLMCKMAAYANRPDRTQMDESHLWLAQAPPWRVRVAAVRGRFSDDLPSTFSVGWFSSRGRWSNRSVYCVSDGAFTSPSRVSR